MKFNPHFTVLSGLDDASTNQRRLKRRRDQRRDQTSAHVGEFASGSGIQRAKFRSAAASPAWCSTPEFCVFLSHDGFCPPPPAAA